jgi:hypothetical protein
MITLEVTVKITVDVDSENDAKNWILDTLEKNLNHEDENVEILETE